ncbi:hypothetical protein BDY24DRAFT_440688 [Mrakia frigida]|uniref:uncharacterized protein n=1 Tax=Mrakia frigida TaxID=29902 RepID=UPI003FCC21E6
MVFVYPSTASEKAIRIPFYTIQILSASLLSFLLLIFYAQKKKRHPTLLNLIIALIIDSALHCVIMGQEDAPSVAVAVCSTAFAISGILATLGTFAAIIFRMWVIVVLDRSNTIKWEKFIDISLLVIPWFCCIAMLIVSTVASALHPENIAVTVLGAYNLDGRITYTSRGIAVLFLLIALIFEIWTVVVCIRRPSRLHASAGDSQTTSDARYVTKSPFDFGFTIRVLSFGIYAGGSVIFAAISLVGSSFGPSIYQALAGIVVFLIFGSQRFLRILPSNEFHGQSQILHSTIDVRNDQPSSSNPTSKSNKIGKGRSFSVDRRGPAAAHGSEISLETIDTRKDSEAGHTGEFQVEVVREGRREEPVVNVWDRQLA